MHALIICNGFPPPEQLLLAELKQADLVIGADGGGNILLEQDIIPDFVIGDMDSFRRPDTISFELIHDPDQDTNDLHKALGLALEQEVTTCTVLGAFGIRMDHSLTNLSVLKQFDTSFDSLVFKDKDQQCIMVTSSYRGEARKGTTVSLFPLSGRAEGITTKGLKYPLTDEYLVTGERVSTLNETVEPSFSIKVGDGDLVVFIGRGE
ncbi:MAG: thiamine diphosphokinase [Balneolaceae bacterium]|nr:thiamine diphosphokinase [Balneolaceae bacterium]